MLVTNPFLYRKTVRLDARARAVDVTSMSLSLRRSAKLVSGPASTAVSGRAVDLRRASRIVASGAAAAVQPMGVGVLWGRMFGALPNSLVIDTVPTVLQKSRVAGFIKTEMAIDPQAVNLLRDSRLQALVQTLSVNPSSVGMSFLLGTLTVTPESMALETRGADIRAARVLTPVGPTVDISARPAALLRGYPLQSNPAALDIGTPALLIGHDKRIEVVQSAVDIAGIPTEMTYIPYEISYISSVRDSVDRTAYSFAGMALGEEHPLRHILVAIQTTATGNTAIASVSVNGAPLAKLIERGGSNRSSYSFWMGPVPTGLTGTVALSHGASMQSFSSVAVFRVINPPRLTPFASTIASAGTNTEKLDVPAGGHIVAVGYQTNNNNHTWTGVTEVDDANVGTGRASYALGRFADAVTAHTISAAGAGVIGAISI